MKIQKADQALRKVGAYHEQIEDAIAELQAYADSLKALTEENVTWADVAESAHLARELMEQADFAYNRSK